MRITGGPLEGSRGSYTARIYWSGWDQDGLIVNYEYTVDPPAAFTSDEIAHPEDFPELRLDVVLGPHANEDTLVVAKQVGGQTVSFRWIETGEFSRIFTFRTPHPDSVSVGGALSPDSTFSGVHRVYVRARDNEAALSDPDQIGYTAFTITPISRILQPDVTAEISNLGPVLTARWDGFDPDGPLAGKKPAGYLFKLLRLDTLSPPIPIIAVNSPDILFTRNEAPWEYQSGDTLTRAIPLGTPGQYLFGVRAVDASGGVEPFLSFGRNAFKFQAFATGGKPILLVTEPSVGTFAFRGLGQTETVEVPRGRRLRFTWSAITEDYGGTVEAFSWGVDVPDLDREGPESGWSGWGHEVTGNATPIVFDSPGIHVLYVRVRDVAGTVTLATLILRVIDFPFDREVLVLDDSFDKTFPRDAEHDQFWRDCFTAYGGIPPQQIFEYHAFGANDTEALNPAPPSLEELGHYKLVIWECLGSGYNGQTALVRATAASPILAAYVGTGGKLWLGGRMTVAATVLAANGQNADLTYPKAVNPGQFAWDFLKLHTSRINNDKGGDPQHALARAIPFPGRPEIYPVMDVERTKLNLVQLAPGYGDAVFDPIFAHGEVNPPFVGTLDSLYTYGAAGPILLGQGSVYHNRLNAVRWSDPDPDREQGRTQWFGFSLYFMQNEQAQETFRRSLDWFREEPPPSGP